MLLFSNMTADMSCRVANEAAYVAVTNMTCVWLRRKSVLVREVLWQTGLVLACRILTLFCADDFKQRRESSDRTATFHQVGDVRGAVPYGKQRFSVFVRERHRVKTKISIVRHDDVHGGNEERGNEVWDTTLRMCM